jgi:glycosyltransferase involved in cell wall biosynthesis
LESRRGILNLTDVVTYSPPDWLLLQFEQFSYGRWGLNPFLQLAMRHLRHRASGTRIGVMFHEDFIPASGLKSAVMSTWQRAQFWILGHLADVTFFSTEPWAEKYQSWFPSTPIYHLPVGSNIPCVDADPKQERERLGLPSNAFVIGVFGGAHPSRLLNYIRESVAACAALVSDCRVLYVGPHGDRVRNVLQDTAPLLDMGALPAEEVSRCFATMDVHLAPFKNGVSTRRGSFLVGLQHGVATLSCIGPQTGSLLRAQNGMSFSLSCHDQLDEYVRKACTLCLNHKERWKLGHAGQVFFLNHFSWPIIANRLLQMLNSAGEWSDHQPESC